MSNTSDLSENFLTVVKTVNSSIDIKAKLAVNDNGERLFPCAFKDATTPMICEDQCVAVIEIKCCGVFFESNHIHKEKRDEADKQYKNCDLPVIALVMESPHVSEFFVKQQKVYEERKPPRPAMGDAGENLEKYILGNLAKYRCINDQKEDGAYFVTSTRLTQGKYRLYLVNAVQYQCSLGESGDAKDEIFNKFFSRKDAQKDFVKRLNDINPTIIINCCTKGYKDENRMMVQKVINKNFAQCQRLIGIHPSSAHFAHGFKDA